MFKFLIFGKKTHLLSVVFLLTAPLLAKEGWLVHLVPPNKNFQTEIVIHNNSLNTGMVFFEDGPANVEKISIQGGATVELQGSAIGSGEHTHLRYYTQSELITVAIRYTTKDGVSPLVVPATDQVARLFRFESPNLDQVWQGLAIVNAGTDPARIEIKQYSDQKEILLDAVLEDELEPGAKHLSLISNLDWARNVPSTFEVTSNQPLAAVLLLGNTVGSFSMVSQVQPLEVSSVRLTARVSGGFMAIEEEVVIEDNMLTFKGVTVAIPKFQAFLDDMMTAGFSDLVIDPIPNACCDLYFYSASIAVGATMNEFFFSDGDLKQKTDAPSDGLEIVRKIFLTAEELTGKDSMVFSPN